MAAPIFVADEVVTATKMNSLPKGVLGYAAVTANQTGISTIADLTGLSVTVDVAADRRIRITGHGLMIQRTSGPGIAQGYVRESTTILGEFGRHTLTLNDQHFMDGGVIVVSPSSGSHTYKLSLSTTAGTVDLNAAAALPAYILVEDIGGV